MLDLHDPSVLSVLRQMEAMMIDCWQVISFKHRAFSSTLACWARDLLASFFPFSCFHSSFRLKFSFSFPSFLSFSFFSLSVVVDIPYLTLKYSIIRSLALLFFRSPPFPNLTPSVRPPFLLPACGLFLSLPPFVSLLSLPSLFYYFASSLPLPPSTSPSLPPSLATFSAPPPPCPSSITLPPSFSPSHFPCPLSLIFCITLFLSPARSLTPRSSSTIPRYAQVSRASPAG
jgi:hypothetical protein